MQVCSTVLLLLLPAAARQELDPALAAFFADYYDTENLNMSQMSLERERGFEVSDECKECSKYSGLSRPSWCPETYLYHCEDLMPHGFLGSAKYKTCRTCCIQTHKSDAAWDGMWMYWCARDGGPDVPKLLRRRTTPGYYPDDTELKQDPLYSTTKQGKQLNMRYNPIPDPAETKKFEDAMARAQYGVDLNEEYDQKVERIKNEVEERESYFSNRQAEKNGNQEELDLVKNSKELAKSVEKAMKKGPDEEKDMFMDDLMNGFYLKSSLEREGTSTGTQPPVSSMHMDAYANQLAADLHNIQQMLHA